MSTEKYSKMFQTVLKIKNQVFQLFERGDKNKEELHEFAEKELGKNGIGFPRRSENYRWLVERLANERSSQIIPNGTSPYEELFEFFGLKIG